VRSVEFRTAGLAEVPDPVAGTNAADSAGGNRKGPDHVTSACSTSHEAQSKAEDGVCRPSGVGSTGKEKSDHSAGHSPQTKDAILDLEATANSHGEIPAEGADLAGPY
jgi:hypothetical protein